MATRPILVKRYTPSPNPDSADQTSYPEPLVDRLEMTAGLLGRWVNPPAVFEKLIDNAEFLDWSRRRARLSSPSSVYENALDEPSPSSYDVYVVGRAPSGGPELPAHWSVYTQGHFYHLSAEARDVCPPGVACGIRVAANGEDITLKDDDFSPTGNRTTSQDPLSPLLIAYQIGQTDYTPCEIFDVGKHIINDMDSYCLFQRNCQHFMNTLIMNILMRKRDNSIFMGTTQQIVSWDLESKCAGDHHNSAEGGCLIVAPQNRPSTLKGKFEALVDTELLESFIVSLRNSIESPTGWMDIDPAITSPHEHIDPVITPHKYWKQQSKYWKQQSEYWKQQWAPIAQDFRERRWKDALFGREVFKVE